MFDRSWTGVIDIGSNAIRLEIGTQRAGMHFPIFREREKIRLGEHVFHTGVVPKRVVRRTAQAVRRLVKVARETSASELVIVATAAVREAVNRDEVVQAIERAAGLRVEVLTGVEEAELLGYAAAGDPSFSADRGVVVLDIGGGSTEISYVYGGEPRHMWSVPVGAVRLMQLFLFGRDRLRSEDRIALEAYISRAFDIIPRHVLPENIDVAGSSGNVRALAAMINCGRSAPKLDVVSRDEVAHAYARLAEMRRLERLSLPTVDKDRADVIVTASAIAHAFLQKFGLEKMRPTKSGLAAGVALRLCRRDQSKWSISSEGMIAQGWRRAS